MAKISGLSTRIFTQGFDLSGDVSAIQTIEASQQPLEVPTLDSQAMKRIGGVLDGKISASAWFDPGTLPLDAFPPTADSEHAPYAWTAAASLPSTDRLVMVPLGVAIGDSVAMLNAKQATFNVARAPGSAISATADFQANDYGLEWGVMLTAGKQTDASAANSTSIDGLAASASLGASAQCQVFSVATGTVVPVAQDSADDAAFAAITGLTFTGVATAGAPTAERLETSATLQIRRYRRCASTGTFTNAVIAMGLNVR